VGHSVRVSPEGRCTSPSVRWVEGGSSGGGGHQNGLPVCGFPPPPPSTPLPQCPAGLHASPLGVPDHTEHRQEMDSGGEGGVRGGEGYTTECWAGWGGREGKRSSEDCCWGARGQRPQNSVTTTGAPDPGTRLWGGGQQPDPRAPHPRNASLETTVSGCLESEMCRTSGVQYIHGATEEVAGHGHLTSGAKFSTL